MPRGFWGLDVVEVGGIGIGQLVSHVGQELDFGSLTIEHLTGGRRIKSY